MKTQILEKLNDLKNKSGKSYEQIKEDLGFATSTVNRWHKGESTPDIDDLTTLVEYYGGSMEELFAAVGKQEMTATQTIGYQGAEAMVQHYEARLSAKDDLYAQLQYHHEQRIQQEKDHHDKSVEYLKEEIKRLRGNVESLTSKKNIVFWVLVGIIVALLFALSLALGTDAII